MAIAMYRVARRAGVRRVCVDASNAARGAQKPSTRSPTKSAAAGNQPSTTNITPATNPGGTSNTKTAPDLKNKKVEAATRYVRALWLRLLSGRSLNARA